MTAVEVEREWRGSATGNANRFVFHSFLLTD